MAIPLCIRALDSMLYVNVARLVVTGPVCLQCHLVIGCPWSLSPVLSSSPCRWSPWASYAPMGSPAGRTRSQPTHPAVVQLFPSLADAAPRYSRPPLLVVWCAFMSRLSPAIALSYPLVFRLSSKHQWAGLGRWAEQNQSSQTPHCLLARSQLQWLHNGILGGGASLGGAVVMVLP